MTIQSNGYYSQGGGGPAAFHLHEELDERRDRNNDGKPESELNLILHRTGSLTLCFSGQPPSYVDLRTTVERISSKKNRVSCCDLHCLCISCTRFVFSLLNLCLHLSLNPPHPFIMTSNSLSPLTAFHQSSGIKSSGTQMPEMDVVSFDHTASSPV